MGCPSTLHVLCITPKRNRRSVNCCSASCFVPCRDLGLQWFFFLSQDFFSFPVKHGERTPLYSVIQCRFIRCQLSPFLCCFLCSRGRSHSCRRPRRKAGGGDNGAGRLERQESSEEVDERGRSTGKAHARWPPAVQLRRDPPIGKVLWRVLLNFSTAICFYTCFLARDLIASLRASSFFQRESGSLSTIME